MTADAAGALVEAAPAKLNLYLHVLGRRSDGYHELDSLVAFADMHDTVTVAPGKAPGDALSLALDGPMASALAADGAAADNLVLRAARMLAEAVGRAPALRLGLTKRLPVASGIGGGSADAAACLRALCRLWRIAPDRAPVPELALALGADVPACLAGRPAFLGGIGERLAPAPLLPAMALVLANPGVPVPTPSVFRAMTAQDFSGPARFDRAPADAAALVDLLRARGNDLAGPARRLAPAIGTVLAALEAQPGCLLARLSGSGATCFGLFAEPAGAALAAAVLARAEPGWWVVAGRLLAEGEVP